MYIKVENTKKIQESTMGREVGELKMMNLYSDNVFSCNVITAVVSSTATVPLHIN